MLVPCFLPARPVGREKEQRKGGEVDGDSATKIMPSGSPAVATSNLHCYLCKITIVLIESKKNQTSHFVVATNACLPGPTSDGNTGGGGIYFSYLNDRDGSRTL